MIEWISGRRRTSPTNPSHSQFFQFSLNTLLRPTVDPSGAAVTPTTAPFAAGGWIKPTDTSRNVTLWGQVDQSGAQGNPGFLQWSVGVNNLAEAFAAIRTNGTTTSIHSAPNVVSGGVWQHLFLTFTNTGGSGLLQIFVNGVQVASGATASATIDLSSKPFRIGNDTAYVEPFDGDIDDCGLWIGTVPNASSLYSGGAGKSWRQLTSGDKTGIAGYWGLNEGTGATSWADASGQGISLTDEGQGVTPAAPFVDPTGPG